MYIFIVNPVAGNGRGRRVFNQLARSETYREIITSHYFTHYPGHAEELAREISSSRSKDVTGIIVIGGDGTIHEVMNGISDVDIPISFIPGGSGNDFGRGSGIKGSPAEILKRIVHDEKGIPYWRGNYKLDNSTVRTFVNSIGLGFDAEIAQKANHSIYKKFFNKLRLGNLSYVIAIIQVLFRFKPFRAEIELEHDKKVVSDCWMITVANHQYYGGGMKIIPTARIQPNYFPILIIQGISKWKILGLFLTVFTGKHITFKEVHLFQAKQVIIHTSQPITFQVDGQTGSCQNCSISKK
ncbi:diacylglycerol/lipid kinase family protein [Ornithinibacillus scapharcae]|uniref:diacylglycerol/lipid kinase family protein n=1 Tax=Ornithinibacillus scapharcae TaxID=1147159 RepID=UPI000225ADF3|nr:diacylglycerol kinase family protein [Ornithinibacillus scapharcae]